MSSITQGNAKQYATSEKLAARARLHQAYSHDEQPWFSFVASNMGLVPGDRVLDLGCGPGWFWAGAGDAVPAGLHLTLADLSPGMVEEATTRCRDLNFASVDGVVADASALPFADASFDMAFSSLVFFEIPTIAEMTVTAAEIARVLRPGGVFILLIGAEELYAHEWATVKVDYPENRDCRSGDAVRVFLSEVGLELTDYYWTDADYRQVFAGAGLSVAQLHQPLGTAGDGQSWINEDKVPPFSIYVARK